MQPVEIHIDFETRSAVELKKAGADVYARDPSTDVLCMAYAYGNDEPKLWKLGEPFPFGDMTNLIFVAHNAPFELSIWNNTCVPKYGWPFLLPSQTYCTMAKCYALGIPGALEKAAPALGLEIKKDMKGNRVMLQLCQPKDVLEDGTVLWYDEWDYQEKYDQVYAYCLQDVRVEQGIDRRLLNLSDGERKTWLLDYEINQRGVYVDIKAIDAALEIVRFEGKRLDDEIRKVTDNAVSTCNAAAQIVDWLGLQGIDTGSIAKSEVATLLERTDLPPQARRVLELRKEAAKTSTKKLLAMREGVCKDGRVRGLFQWHGTTTGRWAGRRIQLQNLPRPKMSQDDIEAVFQALYKSDLVDARDEIDLIYGRPLSVLSDCLRGFLIAAPRHDLIAADWSNIEGRKLAWLAGEEWKLDAFRGYDEGKLPDIYVQSFARAYNMPLHLVEDSGRQVGKVMELALGYQGGKGAFQSMARQYGVKMGDDKAEEIKLAWREAHPKTVKFWYALEQAAMNAIGQPKQKFQAGAEGRKITYLKNGSFLFCRLPSGRVIVYPYPKIEMIDTPWGVPKEGMTYMAEDSITRKWERHKAYGGMLCENVTQAASACLLRDGLEKSQARGYPVVMHCHDEIVWEVPSAFGSTTEIEKIMKTSPPWASGLPLNAKAWRGRRYRK